MTNPKTPGDLFFERYCDLNGYLHDHDVEWRERFGVDTDKNPDYLIDRVADEAIVEVKNFETTRVTKRLLAEPGRAVWWTPAESFGTIQSAVRYAAEQQLAPFATVGIPLVVALTNPCQADVSLDPEDVVSALLGPTQLREMSPGGRIQSEYTGGGAVLTTDANGKWINRVPHLSAVVTAYGLPDFPHVDVYDYRVPRGSPALRCPAPCSTPTTTLGADS
jgi:hypothetical protein